MTDQREGEAEPRPQCLERDDWQVDHQERDEPDREDLELEAARQIPGAAERVERAREGFEHDHRRPDGGAAHHAPTTRARPPAWGRRTHKSRTPRASSHRETRGTGRSLPRHRPKPRPPEWTRWPLR